MNCHEIQDLLTPYLLGDLDPAKAAEVQAHIQKCPTCQASVDDMQATLQFLRNGLADTSGVPEHLPETFTRQFQERCCNSQRIASPKSSSQDWGIRVLKFAAVFAVIFMLAGLFLPNLASVRERARRVNDLSNLNGLWKAASQWGLDPINTWRPTFPESLDAVVKEAKLPEEMLLSTSTKEPVEYYLGAESEEGNRPLFVSHGKKGRNVITVAGQGRWIEDGTPEAEALNKQLAALPKQVATVAKPAEAAAAADGLSETILDYWRIPSFKMSEKVGGFTRPAKRAREDVAQAPAKPMPMSSSLNCLSVQNWSDEPTPTDRDDKNIVIGGIAGQQDWEAASFASVSSASDISEKPQSAPLPKAAVEQNRFPKLSDSDLMAEVEKETHLATVADRSYGSDASKLGAGVKRGQSAVMGGWAAGSKVKSGRLGAGEGGAGSKKPDGNGEYSRGEIVSGGIGPADAKSDSKSRANEPAGLASAGKDAVGVSDTSDRSDRSDRSDDAQVRLKKLEENKKERAESAQREAVAAAEASRKSEALRQVVAPTPMVNVQPELRKVPIPAPRPVSVPLPTPAQAQSSLGVKVDSGISSIIKNAESTRLGKVQEFQKGWKFSGEGRATKAEFAIFKAKYQDGDWNCNPDALNNLMSQICAWSKNNIKAKLHQEVVDVGSDQLFALKPPFIYLTGDKDFHFTDQEVRSIRDYLLVGGAIWVDNSGPGKGTPFDLALRREIKRILPDRDFENIPADHDVYNSYFDSLSLLKGINDKPEPNEKIDIGGETAVLYTLNGYGSLWDHYTLNSNNQVEVVTGKTNFGLIMPVKSSTSEALVKNAYKLGINATVHLLTRYQDKLRAIPVDIDLPLPSNTPPPPPPEPAESNVPPVTAPVCRAMGVNQFVSATANPFSTFSIDVDTASYTLSRNYLLRGQLPPSEAVRTEEFVNYFDYDYAPPNGPTFGVYTDCGPSAFGRGMSLLKIGVKGRRLGREEKRAAVLTLLIDTSGSMATPDRIEMVKSALSQMVERLNPADRIAIVQYDSHARLLLEHTPASDKKRILDVIENLQTSGSTSLEEGMVEAYATAARGFNGTACNRVLLLSDGMANLGTTAAEDILKSVAGYRKQGITLSVFGFGLGAYNDVMLETLANKGDGVYAFIDSQAEAKRVLVDDLAATINLIARDVKIQVEFNPRRVKQYRQLGYENRQLKKEQFRDDSVDAGEIGSGQSVTALYELELQGDAREPLGMVRVRCRNALTGQIEEIEQPIAPPSGATPFEAMDVRFRLAAAAAEFSEILRGSPFAAGSQFEDVARVLRPIVLELNLDNGIQEFLRMTQTGLMPKFQEAE